MFRSFAAALTFCATLAAPAFADPRTDKVDAALRAWMDKVGASKAVLTLWRGGIRQHDLGIGQPIDTPIELASLSKAITATCALSLIADGTWSAQTTAQEVLGKGGDLTVGQLMTHRAGLAPDSTQGLPNSVLPAARARAPQTTDRALDRPHDAAVAQDFFYNNENYAVLGDMIATQTGSDYQTACTARALAPAKASGQPSTRVGPMLPWGGWQMTAQDYAAFLNHWFGPEGAVGSAPEKWPRHSFEGQGYFYGPGMFQRPLRGSNNFWHFGSHCFPGQLSTGAFAVSLFGDWSAVVGYDACLDRDQMLALDQTLLNALLGPLE